MALPAAEGHSFIVRIWRESREEPGAGSTWRGTIEHVEDGRREPLTELRQVERFIAPYLRQLRVTRGWRDRLGWRRLPGSEGEA